MLLVDCKHTSFNPRGNVPPMCQAGVVLKAVDPDVLVKETAAVLCRV